MTSPPPAVDHQRTPEQRLTRVEQSVTELAKAVAALRDSGGNPAPAPWCWPELDRPAALDLWDRLSRWIGWLVDEYPTALSEWPPCWYLHSDAVLDATALYVAWRNANYGTTKPNDNPINWHDRWLAGFRTRMLGDHGALTVCSNAGLHEQAAQRTLLKRWNGNEQEASDAFIAAQSYPDQRLTATANRTPHGPAGND